MPSVNQISMRRLVYAGKSIIFQLPIKSNQIKFICHKFSTQYNNSQVRIAFGWTERR